MHRLILAESIASLTSEEYLDEKKDAKISVEQKGVRFPADFACTTNFQNNCGLNALAHKIVKNIDTILPARFQLLHKAFLDYYQLKIENLTVERLQELLKNIKNPVHTEVLLGPVLRAILQKEVSNSGFKEGDPLYESVKGTGMLSVGDVFTVAMKFGISVECYRAPDYKNDENKEVRDNLLRDVPSEARPIWVDNLKLVHIEAGAGHWEYKEEDKEEVARHNQFYDEDKRMLSKGFKYDSGRHLEDLRKVISSKLASEAHDIGNLLKEFERSAQSTNYTDLEEDAIVRATSMELAAHNSSHRSIHAALSQSTPIPTSSKLVVKSVPSCLPVAHLATPSQPVGLNEEDITFLHEAVNKALGLSTVTVAKNQSPSAKHEHPIKEAQRLPKRQPFYLPKVEVKCSSPVSIIRKLYEDAITSEQKQACLRYLLHYQHYNAEFTSDENQRLGYPKPLCAPQELPGYIRTEYHRVVELIQPWINEYLTDFYQETFELKQDQIKDFVSLGTSSTITLLKSFFAKHYHIEELDSFVKNQKSTGDEKKGDLSKLKNIVIINLNLTDLKKTGLEVLAEQLKIIDQKLKPGNIRVKHPNIRFLFVLKTRGIECAIIWGAKWASPKKLNDLACLPLNSSELFGIEFIDTQESVFSLLNKFGAVPDRLALNQFITAALGKVSLEDKKPSFDLDLKTIGVSEIKEYKDERGISAFRKEWKELVVHMKKEHEEKKKENKEADKLDSRFYQEAILSWQTHFFASCPLVEEFALPLLCTQVAPWVLNGSSVIQWAKAYQNLCEIIMLCLEYFPEKAKERNFEEVILKLLNSGGVFTEDKVYKSVGLYSYAMSAIFDVLHQVTHRTEFKENPLSVISISQNYFETLGVVENMAAQNHIVTQKVDSLDDIDSKAAPNILIADIHPNNASKERLFQNAVAPWIQNALKISPERHMILILDITLNHLSDSVIQETLSLLSPFISEGRLEIFLIQSLAKLLQNGADNFSGGSCVYLGNLDKKNRHPKFPPNLPQKAAFFGIMAEHFQDITHNYFRLIRNNTDWMHKELASCFSRTSNIIYIPKDTKSSIPFCAMNVVPNVDQSTVYVAIGFTPFFENLRIPVPHDLVELKSFDLGGEPLDFNKYKRNTYIITNIGLFYADKENKVIDSIPISSKNLNLLKEKLFLSSEIVKDRDIPASKLSSEQLAIIASIAGHRCLSSKSNSLSKEEKENYVKSFLKLILKCFALRGLPITGRQSFGFSLSNMSHVVYAIRFSIGVEERELFNQYIELIENFSYGLSLSMAHHQGIFNIKAFENSMEWIYTTLKVGQGKKPLATVSLRKEIWGEYGDETTEKMGKANIYFRNNQLFLSIERNLNGQEAGMAIKHVSESNIGIIRGWSDSVSSMDWSYSLLFRLFLQAKIACESLYVLGNDIGGFLKNGYLFLDDDQQLKDEESGIFIKFEPQFSLSLPNRKQYSADQVFVRMLPEFKLGVTPVTMSRLVLKPEVQNEIFNRCARYYLRVSEYKERPDSVFLEFVKEKPSENYSQHIKGLLKKEGGLSNVVRYLNELNLDNLPLLHDQYWRDYQDHAARSLNCLHNILEKLGSFLVKNLTTANIKNIRNIEDDNCRKCVVRGIFNGLLVDSTSEKSLDPKVAEAIAQMFSIQKFKPYGDMNFDVCDDWFQRMYNHIVKNPNDFKRLTPYLKAIFPFVRLLLKCPRDLGNTDYSILLYLIGEKASFFPAWGNYIKKLESRLLSKIISDITELCDITFYLRLYVRYWPLKDKTKGKLLMKITKKSKGLRTQWIIDPDFYYRPLDKLDLHVKSIEKLILIKKNQRDIQEFFVGIGCKHILLDLLSEEYIESYIWEVGMRWAIITEDNDLFAGLLAALQKTELKKRILDNLVSYASYLDRNNVTQKQLAEHILATNTKYQELISELEKVDAPPFLNSVPSSEAVNKLSYEKITEDVLGQFNKRRRGREEGKSEDKAQDDQIRKYIFALVEQRAPRVFAVSHDAVLQRSRNASRPLNQMSMKIHHKKTNRQVHQKLIQLGLFKGNVKLKKDSYYRVINSNRKEYRDWVTKQLQRS